MLSRKLKGWSDDRVIEYEIELKVTTLMISERNNFSFEFRRTNFYWKKNTFGRKSDWYS